MNCKNKLILVFLILFVFLFLNINYFSRENFDNNSVFSTSKNIINNITNPLKRNFRKHYNNLYDKLNHILKKIEYYTSK